MISITILRILHNQERRTNRLRDYTTIAGPLGVSHLLLFSRSTTGNTNLRLALIPRGPTLHFRVEKYSLCKDIRKSIRHPKGELQDFLTPPLLVMNNMTSPKTTDDLTAPVSKQLESLITTVFQSLFPPISPQHTALPSIRRVLILDRELLTTSNPSLSSGSASYHINLRHYAITTKKTGLSRGIRRLDATKKLMKDSTYRKRLLDLGKLDDVAEYLLDPKGTGGGYTSGSESEIETDAEVEVLEKKKGNIVNRRHFESSSGRDYKESGRGTPSIEKRAVKLVELGPRMRLRMTKVEDGVCTGKVMWHEYLTKSQNEMDEMEANWEGRRKEKEERKKAQRENLERKKRPKEANYENVEDMEDEDEWASDRF